MTGNPYQVPRKTASIATSDTTAIAGSHLPVNAASGARTVTLPAGKSEGAHLSIEKVDSSTNTVTVSGNIRGAATSIVLTARYESLELIADAAGSWRPIASHVPKNELEKIFGGRFNVRSYGAVGDGTTDDTIAFKAAFAAACAANGTVIIPQPSSAWLLTDTITIAPPSGRVYVRCNIEASGYSNAIRWDGANGAAVFRVLGLKRSTIKGVHIDLATAATSGKTGVIGWDIDTTVDYGSTSNVTYDSCFVGLNAMAGGVGWRLGHVSGDAADISFYAWVNCNASATKGTTGTRGWLNEGGNSLNNYWFGGAIAGLEKGVTNVSDAGAKTAQGNDSMFFYGLGSSANSTDFEFAVPGSYVISGGRFEVGSRFLNVPTGSNHVAVVVHGINMSSYAPADGILVNFDRPGTLTWDTNYVRGGSVGGVYGAHAFKANGFTGKGSLIFRGGGISATEPFFTAGSNWQVWVQSVGLLNASNQSTGYATTRLGDSATALGLNGFDPNPGNPFIPASLRWFINPLVTGNVRTLAPTANRLTGHLFHSGSEGVTLDKFDLNVTSAAAAGALVRIGIYTISNQTLPWKWSTSAYATLLAEVGTLATTVTGQQILTPPSPVVIPANTWFMVTAVDQGASPSATRTVGGAAGSTWASKLGVTGTGGYGTASPGLALYMDNQSGALPTTFTPNGVMATDNGIGIRRSA